MACSIGNIGYITDGKNPSGLSLVQGEKKKNYVAKICPNDWICKH